MELIDRSRHRQGQRMTQTSISESMQSAFPEMSAEKIKILTFRTVAWLSILGSSTVARIEEAKTKELDDVEERAIIIAASVISRVVAAKYPSEVERFDTMANCLLTVQHDDVTPV
jgi:hypothetical protein